MKIKYVLLFMISCLFFSNTNAQVSEKIQGDAAFLFAYYPEEGKQKLFNEGYKSHLDWHRNNNDPLPWYGWYVITGDRLGMFVDGTFGISFEAFDNRVAPGKDGAHFHQAVAPFGDAAYRKVFKLNRKLSTATRLEDWDPSSSLEVYTFSIASGREPAFEETIAKLVSALKSSENELNPEFTFYEKLSGGSLPAYLLMVPRDGFSYYDSETAITTLSTLIIRSFDEATADELLAKLSQTIRQIDGETWSYRSDLSYFPQQ